MTQKDDESSCNAWRTVAHRCFVCLLCVYKIVLQKRQNRISFWLTKVIYHPFSLGGAPVSPRLIFWLNSERYFIFYVTSPTSAESCFLIKSRDVWEPVDKHVPPPSENGVLHNILYFSRRRCVLYLWCHLVFPLPTKRSLACGLWRHGELRETCRTPTYVWQSIPI